MKFGRSLSIRVNGTGCIGKFDEKVIPRESNVGNKLLEMLLLDIEEV